MALTKKAQKGESDHNRSKNDGTTLCFIPLTCCLTTSIVAGGVTVGNVKISSGKYVCVCVPEDDHVLLFGTKNNCLLL